MRRKTKIYLNEGEKINEAIYKDLTSNGFYLPPLTSSAISRTSLLNATQSTLFVVFNQTDLEESIVKKRTLIASTELAYDMLQRFLLATRKKVLPFENAPNAEYIAAILDFVDPQNTLKLLEAVHEYRNEVEIVRGTERFVHSLDNEAVIQRQYDKYIDKSQKLINEAYGIQNTKRKTTNILDGIAKELQEFVIKQPANIQQAIQKMPEFAQMEAGRFNYEHIVKQILRTNRLFGGPFLSLSSKLEILRFRHGLLHNGEPLPREHDRENLTDAEFAGLMRQQDFEIDTLVAANRPAPRAPSEDLADSALLMQSVEGDRSNDLSSNSAEVSEDDSQINFVLNQTKKVKGLSTPLKNKPITQTIFKQKTPPNPPPLDSANTLEAMTVAINQYARKGPSQKQNAFGAMKAYKELDDKNECVQAYLKFPGYDFAEFAVFFFFVTNSTAFRNSLIRLVATQHWRTPPLDPIQNQYLSSLEQETDNQMCFLMKYDTTPDVGYAGPIFKNVERLKLSELASKTSEDLERFITSFEKIKFGDQVIFFATGAFYKQIPPTACISPAHQTELIALKNSTPYFKPEVKALRITTTKNGATVDMKVVDASSVSSLFLVGPLNFVPGNYMSSFPDTSLPLLRQRALTVSTLVILGSVQDLESRLAFYTRGLRIRSTLVISTLTQSNEAPAFELFVENNFFYAYRSTSV